MGKNLSGLGEISAYLKWSENKTLSIHKTMKLPMAKIGGQWEAHSDLLDEWLKEQIRTKSGVITVSSGANMAS